MKRTHYETLIQSKDLDIMWQFLRFMYKIGVRDNRVYSHRSMLGEPDKVYLTYYITEAES